MIDPRALADELLTAAANRRIVEEPPSSRDSSFDLTAAYAVGNEVASRRAGDGHRIVGVKVGYANKAVWRALKLETLVWGPMYDDTVRYADAAGGTAPLSVSRMMTPKIEPEVVFRMKSAVSARDADPAAVLGAVEWIALGFEIIHCPFPGWKFQPVDFVAAFGLHAALVVGPPRPVDPASIPALVESLARFTVRLSKNDQLVAEGSGRNSLRSPALCVAELASAMERRADPRPIAPGDLVSTGTLTESQPLGAGERWRVEADGLDVAPVALSTIE
jgi:2-oxo-3-hexenedioate decarboxylase